MHLGMNESAKLESWPELSFPGWVQSGQRLELGIRKRLNRAIFISRRGCNEAPSGRHVTYARLRHPIQEKSSNSVAPCSISLLPTLECDPEEAVHV